MEIKKLWSHIWPVLAIFVAVSIMFLPEYQGKTLSGGDAIESIAKTKNVRDYIEKDDRRYLWNPAQFSGMPMLYAAPSDNNVMRYVNSLITFGQKPPISIFFLSALFGFLLGKIGFRMNNILSLTMAVLVTLPLSNLILWKAGHVSKIDVLSYTPLLILGVLLIFEKRKYLSGFLFLAFGISMSLLRRHPQMSYYIFMVFIIYGIIKLIQFAREREDLRALLIGVGVILFAAIIGLGNSTTKLWSMKVHSKESMRGAPILKDANLASSNSSSKEEGLNWEYAMQWSSNWFDLGASFIPRMAGGGSGEPISTKSETFKKYRMKNAPMYWGGLPFTECPLYLGAAAIFLFLFSSFYVKGYLKWWLFLGVLLTLLLSMGKNLEWLNHFLFDYFPLYNVFRAPQSIISITPYFMAPLALIGLQRLLKEGASKEFYTALYWSTGILTAICALSIFVFPHILSFEGLSDATYQKRGLDMSILVSDRKSFLKSDALRSLFFVAGTALALLAFAKNKLKSAPALLIVLGLLLIDFVGVNNRYLKFSDYVSKRKIQESFTARTVDQQIINQEKERHNYRVHDLSINTYSTASTSYHHNTIGGYDPVKMQRYQDLIDVYISKNRMNILNMLNAKYFILPGDSGPKVQQNPGALGVGWVVDSIIYANSPDEEFMKLEGLNTRSTAVINSNDFKDVLQGLPVYQRNGRGNVTISKFSPDEVSYSVNNQSGSDRLFIFSEIWFNGKEWKAYMDGKEIDIIRANYALRALRIPNGAHEVVFEFRPKSYYTGEKITLASSLLLLFLGLGGIGVMINNYRKEDGQIGILFENGKVGSETKKTRNLKTKKKSKLKKK